jgi:hypothetical protein
MGRQPVRLGLSVRFRSQAHDFPVLAAKLGLLSTEHATAADAVTLAAKLGLLSTEHATAADAVTLAAKLGLSSLEHAQGGELVTLAAKLGLLSTEHATAADAVTLAAKLGLLSTEHATAADAVTLAAKLGLAPLDKGIGSDSPAPPGKLGLSCVFTATSPVSLRQKIGQAFPGGNVSDSLSFPSATLSSDTVVVAVALGGGSLTCTVLDNLANTYTLGVTITAGLYTLQLWYNANITGGLVHTVKVTPGSVATIVSFAIMEFVGGLHTGQPDGVKSAFATSTTPATGSLTTGAQTDIAVCAITDNATGVVGITEPGAPWQRVVLFTGGSLTNNVPLSVLYQIPSASSVLNPSWTLAASQSWRAAMLALKA